MVPEVVRVPKTSDSSGGDGQARVHHHPNKPLVNTIPTTKQVERLRAPYCGVEPELAGSLLGQGSDR